MQVSSKIVHHIPTADLTDIEEVRLATPYVSNLVYQKLKRRRVDEVATFLESTRGDHACSAMRGQLFESYVMYRQSEGGEVKYAVKSPQGISAPAGESCTPENAHMSADDLSHLDICLALRYIVNWSWAFERTILGMHKAENAFEVHSSDGSTQKLAG